MISDPNVQSSYFIIFGDIITPVILYVDSVSKRTNCSVHRAKQFTDKEAENQKRSKTEEQKIRKTDKQKSTKIISKKTTQRKTAKKNRQSEKQINRQKEGQTKKIERKSALKATI